MTTSEGTSTMTITTTLKLVVGMILLFALSVPVSAEDWPTYRKDIHRGGVTSEKLELPLALDWACKTSRAPAAAWTESPAAHDYLHRHYNLKPRQNFDGCFQVAVVGQRVYFGSSVSGAMTCLDARSGHQVWTFFTDGPVRLAPTVADGKVYFGSDDGFVYCLDAGNGSVIWKERVGRSADKIWGNERMISVWPVRSSVLVDGGDVYWSAGLFATEGMFLCKRKAVDGSGGWTVAPARPHQGYLVATAGQLIAPSGKTSPVVYRREDGGKVGDLRKNRRGGSWVQVATDELGVFSGPNLDNDSHQFNPVHRTVVASFSRANGLIADQTIIYYNTDSKIVAMARADKSQIWSSDLARPFALIKAGDHVFAGGDGKVEALDAATGKSLWSAPVDGKALGLAVANGALYVSTDRGSIHCFRAMPSDQFPE
jgi:outer membrane protein assembly factor BamB